MVKEEFHAAGEESDDRSEMMHDDDGDNNDGRGEGMGEVEEEDASPSRQGVLQQSLRVDVDDVIEHGDENNNNDDEEDRNSG